MKDLNESQEIKDIKPEVSNPGNVSESAKASIQGINPKECGGQNNFQSDFSQEYVDEKTKYIDDLLAHKKNVLDHVEDWKKSGFSIENELQVTDEEMTKTNRLLGEEFNKKYSNI